MADAAKIPPAAPAAPSGTDSAAAPAAKESAGATLIKAAEHVVVESATAIAKDLKTKTAGDLKNIEKGLSQEIAHETKEGLPSLSEIGEAIVDGVEIVAEEVVEGAEVAVEAVKAHPELIAEAAVAVGIGVASIVQPELIVGSVAMIGKMAADNAKKTATDIVTTASTHVVTEISKDITEDVANDAKVEATSTKTEVTQNETKINEEKGTVTQTETTASSQKTQVVATGIAPPSLDTSKATTETSKDGKEVKIVLPSKSEKATEEDSPPSDAKEHSKPEPPVAEATAKDGEDKGTSVVVTGNGDKKVSVKISDDGTITIGTDSSAEKKEVTETAIDSKSTTSAGKEETLAGEVGSGLAKEETPEIKITPPKSERRTATEDTSTESATTTTEKSAKSSEASASSQEKGETKAGPESKEPTPGEDNPAEIQEPKAVKVVVKAKGPTPEAATKVLQALPLTTGLAPSNSDQILAEIHQKLEKLDKQQQSNLASIINPPETETDKKPASSAVDTHTQNSLAKLHEKLDSLIAANSKSQDSPATDEGPKITQDDLNKIHLKLDKMQEVLAITPNSDPAIGVEHVHQKIDAIHTAILTNKKAQEDAAIFTEDAIEPPFEEEIKASAIDQLHKKFDTMQASLDALASALAQKPRREADMDSESSESIDESIKGIEVSPPALVAETSEVPTLVETPKAVPAAESSLKPGTGLVDDSVKAPSEEAASASNGDGKGPKKGAEVKKHVKRSSFFGGIFG